LVIAVGRFAAFGLSDNSLLFYGLHIPHGVPIKTCDHVFNDKLK